ncbi:hypothetical protein IW261DRAFT_1423502 [Armillaria novae-zelandiae]|uniref:Cupredoxin n=1 Tax=Armillaria novae-zelandiae TaxID=153914 RepID=A0AA39NX96_9AGAR|nr:hypothetical protein IW261DRAFT_1423502 [Armillaria novae-zelandiae]
MHSFTTLFALAAPLLAVAQSTTTIQVGGTATEPGGIFQFNPPNVTVSEGDVITFNFSGAPGNHSITQSSLASPCTPLSGGFDSGWVYIPAAGTPVPQWNLTITNASSPIWFYCKQLVPSPHCKAGMVGAINAPTTGNTSFDTFVSNAQAFSGNPGQEVGALVGQHASASAAPGPIPSGATLFGSPAASATATAPAGGSSGSGGASASTSPSGSASGAGTSSAALNGVAMIMGVALA